ncbi:MAG: Flp family type IVb pilin [Planctomycetota bacterium]
MFSSITRFLAEEDGPTAVEYAVMLALVLMVVIIGVAFLGTSTADSFQESSTQIQSATGG